MTQEDKQLLLVDLCGRLPYSVVIKDRNRSTLIKCDFECHPNLNNLENIKPYLRPMSSMTDEEKEHLQLLHNITTDENYEDNYSPAAWNAISEFNDYCNAHHLDNRGLIGKGLALEAPEQMYD